MQHVGDEPWQSQAPPDPAAQPPASRARVELQQSSGGGGSGGGGQALSSLSPPPLTASSSSPGRPLDGWGQAELQRAQASPRSPSRLRAALHSRATRTAEGGQGLQNTGDAACFLRVEQVEDGPAPTAARQQEDVCIEHIKPDGVRHAAQVEAGIIHQVWGCAAERSVSLSCMCVEAEHLKKGFVRPNSWCRSRPLWICRLTAW